MGTYNTFTTNAYKSLGRPTYIFLIVVVHRIIAITSQKIQPKRGLWLVGKGLRSASIVYIVMALQINRATSDVARDASGG